VLVLGLAVAMPFWPYARCGMGLALYLGALTVLLLGGVWAAVSARYARAAALWRC
jgi:hypothetical protein